MRWCLAFALCLCVSAPAVADPPVDPDGLGHTIDAFLAAGGRADDEAIVVAHDALARCRADLAAHRREDARRRCALAHAAFALGRERALLALARSRAR